MMNLRTGEFGFRCDPVDPRNCRHFEMLCDTSYRTLEKGSDELNGHAWPRLASLGVILRRDTLIEQEVAARALVEPSRL